MGKCKESGCTSSGKYYGFCFHHMPVAESPQASPAAPPAGVGLNLPPGDFIHDSDTGKLYHVPGATPSKVGPAPDLGARGIADEMEAYARRHGVSDEGDSLAILGWAARLKGGALREEGKGGEPSPEAGSGREDAPGEPVADLGRLLDYLADEVDHQETAHLNAAILAREAWKKIQEVRRA